MNKVILTFLLTLSCYLSAKKPAFSVHNTQTVYSKKDLNLDSSNLDQRTFAKDFKARYTDKEFVYEYSKYSQNSWARFKDWLTKILRNFFKISDNKSASKISENVIRFGAIVLIIFAIYMLVKAFINKEGQWIFGKNSNRKILNHEDIEKNLHAVDFAKLIESSLQSGQNRLTIRYYYLWLLKEMSDKELIQWDIEKTNSDYLYEIKDQTLRENFAYLSYLYNNIWYGEYELNESAFLQAQGVFETSIKKLGNE